MTVTTNEKVLLTVEETAERLGVGRTMVFRLLRSGALESVQIGRLRRIRRSAIDDFADRLAAEAVT